jgi:dTDP-4-dehydrorhamnose reductase
MRTAVKTNKMLITGSNGMVGSYVTKVFSDWDLYMTDLGALDTTGIKLDVCDPSEVMQIVKNINPDFVLHLAAATDVDRCQIEPEWAYRVNAIGTQNVALACQETNAHLIYVSTGNVFAGDKETEYTEFDQPDPKNIYGNSKLVGEGIVSSLLNKYYIVRAGWMIGGGVKDKKFVSKMAHMLMDDKISLKVVNDKYGSPTYAFDLLNGISKLIDTGYYGLYHMVNPGMVSRFQIAEVLRDILEMTQVEIESVTSEEFPTPAPRIRMEALSNYKLELLGYEWMRPWKESLEEYVVKELLPVLR